MVDKNKELDLAKQTLEEIELWEKRLTNPKWITKINTLIGKPIDYAFKIMPRGMENVIIKSIEGILNSLIFVSGFSYSEKEIQARVKKISEKNKEMDDLESIKKTAASYITENNIAATLQGFGCGLGGIALIAADIPLIFSITFRVIQQIGTVFNYQMDTIEEKQFIMKILNLGSGIQTVAKVESMLSKEALKSYVKKETFKNMERLAAAKLGKKSLEEISKEIIHAQGKRATKKAIETMTKKISEDVTKNGTKAVVITSTRKTAKDVGQRLTRNKLLQLIPIIGGLIGAGFNFWFVKNISETAYYAYLKRYLYDNYEL